VVALAMEFHQLSSHPISPLVSAIISTYNSETFIVHAIESVLSQTSRQYEAIVVDYGSTENIRNLSWVLDGYIRSHYQESRGPSSFRNSSKVARREHMCFLDTDDFRTPEKLEV